ncbi:kinesin-domain-containing protein [Pleomassaria siparia CBS 279.74]|uniref:Kinesin-like protein n=1 Tax=Pleomassaria siparia CBS 279.74 TaxID=1314801 RepID=A0A6G1KNY2_9PLEO|nr:kinesin-domain-containing protein [Pleomassaria siparia CBS 279.74]
MDAATENHASRSSGLRPPSKIQLPPSPTRYGAGGSGLSEMTEAAANSRGAIRPPTAGGSIKHKPSGLPEPPAKRKTLQERAAEPLSKQPPPSGLRPVNNAVKNAAANGMRGLSASTSRVTSANSSRQATASSFGNTIGHGSRVPGANSYHRSKSAYGHNRSKSHHQTARPGTSMARDVNEDEDRSESLKVFDTESRVEAMEREFNAFKRKMEGETTQASDLKETIKMLQAKVNELETIRTQLTTMNDELRSDLKDTKSYMATANMELESTRRTHSFEVDDMRRKNRNDMEDLQDKYRKEADRIRKENEEAAEKVRKDFETQIDKLIKMHSEELDVIQKKLKVEVEEERIRRTREAQELQTEYVSKLKNAGLDLDTKAREAQLVQGELTNVKADLDRERSLRSGLQAQLTEATTHNLTLDAANKSMRAKIDFLESDSQAQSQAFNELHRRMQEAIDAAEVAQEKLRQEETLRRKLHNQVQELKGNIRVMCRVRPVHPTETEPAKIEFPDADTDSKEVAVKGFETKSAMGNVTTATYSYGFDRVFTPTSQNSEIFEEISQLVQSALDGYNVCIFCYGQTGAGKTYTMSSSDGMIPLATAQIYAEATRLEEKGWRYKIEGSFVEVYNETYNDLLGRSEDLDKKKVEVRHDLVKKTTTLENAVSVVLDGPDRLADILKTADKNRTVAATKANSRSSRSHSVFVLKMVGENRVTGERSEGTLNLVDLAGSERLEHSKAEGARLAETKNINKSLSCLGDVIGALGSGKEGAHIPYRNSKLTYLLQNSLGGNSKTLMFVMVSPLRAHLQETITSLKFATKVHNTHIGTAKKSTKSRD